jgi:hypothetical protein
MHDLDLGFKFNNDYDIQIYDNKLENYDLNLFKGNHNLEKNNNYEFINNLEVMNTFQQTFDDPNIHIENYDCEMESIQDFGYDLCLRK